MSVRRAEQLGLAVDVTLVLADTAHLSPPRDASISATNCDSPSSHESDWAVQHRAGKAASDHQSCQLAPREVAHVAGTKA